MRLHHAFGLSALLLLAACDAGERNALDEAADGANSAVVEQTVEAEARNVMDPLTPPAPGTAGGLLGQPESLIEGSIDPDSAQGAAQVVQGYYALLEEKRFPDALKQWGNNGIYGSTDPAAFARRFDGFSEIHANIGAPGAVEGAAGSLYVSVPVQVYAREKISGKPYYALRTVALRRVNNVDGSSDVQRHWHIARIGAYAAPDRDEMVKEKPAPSN